MRIYYDCYGQKYCVRAKSIEHLTVHQAVNQPRVPTTTERHTIKMSDDLSDWVNQYPVIVTSTYADSYLLYRKNISAYTAPPIHSG